MDHAMVNVQWCVGLFSGLASAGVSQLVISPGSRSTPLVIAADLHPAFDCHVLVDERSAAFFALGMARRHNTPVGLICTSGSAPANWYPAIVEARHSFVPLVLLTADRPWELQSCGANQTIDQIKLFGDQVNSFHALPPAEASPTSLARLHALGRQAVNESLWPAAGPVHINMPFREPLVPAHCCLDVDEVEVSLPAMPRIGIDERQLLALVKSMSAKPGLILCGPGIQDEAFAAEVTRLAARLDCPVLADPLSGLRYGGHDKTRVVSHYSLFLAADMRIESPGWIIRFGAMPVSSALQGYLAARGGRQFVVDHRGRWPDPLNPSAQVLHASPAVLCAQLAGMDLRPARSAWCAAWVGLEKRCEQQLNSVGPELPPEASLMRQLVSGLPDGSLLFSGNSLAIRYLDGYSGRVDRKLEVAGNRGASGIDGNISSFLGLATAHAGQGKMAAIIGDLAFFHDMNGLAAARGLDAVLVIINNNGGGIFAQLPHKDLPGYERYWRTPLDLDYGHAASLYGLPYHKLQDLGRFPGVLAQALAEDGVSLLEVITDPDESAGLHQGVLAAICR